MTERLDSPAFQGNSEPILTTLKQYIPTTGEGLALEVASGSGQHVLYFADNFPNYTFLPTAYETNEVKSINTFVPESKHSNIKSPILLDASSDFKKWGVKQEVADIVININMIHISSWQTCQGLMTGSNMVLKKGGKLFMYGPYNTTNKKMAPKGLIDGKYTSDGNKRFDASLRGRDTSWGIRMLEDVVAEASKNGLTLEAYHHMPSNNFSLVFVKLK